MTDPFIEQARRALNPQQQSRDPLDDLRRKLVRTSRQTTPGHRGGPEQVAFLEAVAENRFLEYLRAQNVNIDFSQLRSAPLNATLPEQLEESEFVKPPVSTARKIRDCYSSLTPAAAASVAVWNVISLHNIQSGRLDASFLAADNERTGGRARIQAALCGHYPEQADDDAPSRTVIDRCVRTVFRRMGGLYHIRGSASVISDCTLSRHWWMGYFTERAIRELALYTDDVWDTLNPHWGQMAEFAVRRLTILANPALMVGLIAHLLYRPAGTNRELEELLRSIGREFSTVDLHAWSAAQICDRLRELRA